MSELRDVLARHPTTKLFVYLGGAPERNLPTDSLPFVGRVREGVAGRAVIAVRGTRPTDTCKEVVGGLVRRTIPRERLVELKSPWVCSRQTIQAAVNRVADGPVPITNLLELCRAAGVRIRVLIS